MIGRRLSPTLPEPTAHPMLRLRNSQSQVQHTGPAGPKEEIRPSRRRDLAPHSGKRGAKTLSRLIYSDRFGLMRGVGAPGYRVNHAKRPAFRVEAELLVIFGYCFDET
jgi:hypothetical protein